MAKSSPTVPACHCGSARVDQCCGPILAGEILAPSAERLMRSRYSAYLLGNENYLRATWHASTRPAGNIIAADEKLQWLGLEVKSDLRLRKRQEAELLPNSTDESRTWAVVEFVARYKIAGRAHRLHEISRFVCENETDGPHWYYVDGSFPER
ncbi:MAG: hypothetical protein HYZ45_05545 [Burkholderiales bacterium]|nr:hypothetical protein [Burkholderiales bacterium]